MDIQDLIIERMQRLLCLGLEGTPAAELLPGTTKIWIERLQRFDPNRLMMAFNIVEERATRWPVPSTIIEAMPTYEHTYREPIKVLAAPVDPAIAAEVARKAREAIEECVRKLSL